MKALMRLLKNEDGVTAIEYALIAALIALTIIVGATYAGTWLNNALTYIGDTLMNSGVPAAPPPAP
jgi:pilus assembly protein Flp/PilA